MGCFGNFLWFIFSGFWQGISWTLAGIFWCITIVGIPIGLQCFKIAGLVFLPFGKRVEYGTGTFLATAANIFWIILSGIPLAIVALINGALLCITIVGIPFGLQCFKFAKLALMPFGTKVY